MDQTDQTTIAAAIRTVVTTKPPDKIHGQPTYSDYKKLRRQEAKTAASIASMKWGRSHDKFALVLTDVEYQTTTGDTTLDTARQPAPPMAPIGLIRETYHATIENSSK